MITDVSFFYKGGRAGILLIHGLTGTPAEMQILGKGLHKAGFTVYGMQLAGHCGDENDLLATSWHDWYGSVERAADRLLQHVDTVFVGGLSMGAVLALKYAADHPQMVKGCGVYGPTFVYDGWSIPRYLQHCVFLLKWFKALGIFQKSVFIERPPYGLKDERIRKTVSESMLSGDSAKGGLAGNPLGSLAEMQELAKVTKAQLHDITVPCLVMHAKNDDIANIETNSGLVAHSVAGPVKMTALENSYHMVTIDRDRKKVIQESVDFFQSIKLRRSIGTSSHQFFYS
ncbi:alpha/beta fold hydrolase [uncultured Bartonella sp.]|uniref:alpha/beta hydrolase n=1 Tax=uncultured Bartonella sp. TaxID=104108 RepID=UPI0026098C11|nr:alpha/beta fold hydrolase [uncultured Bartonella sp.]